MIVVCIPSYRFLAIYMYTYYKDNIIKLPDLHQYSTLIFMHNYVNTKLPSVFDQFFIRNRQQHIHNTRSRDDFRIPIFKFKVGCNSIKRLGALYWNSTTVSKSTSLNIFKKEVRKCITRKYNDT